MHPRGCPSNAPLPARVCRAGLLDSGCKTCGRCPQADGRIGSHDSVARYIKTAADRQVQANLTRNDVQVLAVDDIGLRQESKSGCTVLCILPATAR